MGEPFGVELPDNLGSTTESSGSSEPSSGAAPPGDTSQQVSKASIPQTPETPSVLDLDKLERFRFNGREWSPKDLRNAYLMREDYTRKTQELAEARKFADNFETDLGKVLANPSLLAELKKVYPRAYVELAERYLNSRSPVATQTTETASPNVPSEIDRRLSEMEGHFQQMRSQAELAQVSQIEAWLKSTYESLEKKYPLADPEVVTARAEVLNNVHKQSINEDVLDKLFKASHDQHSGRYEKHYKTKVTQQQQTGVKGKDMGSGGGIPGQAPKGLKTLKDAKAALMERFS